MAEPEETTPVAVLETRDPAARNDSSRDEPQRQDSGAFPRAFIDEVSQAISKDDSARLRELAGDLHEADLGALIEQLPADKRSPLISLMGGAFDFSALTEVDDKVREDILDEMPNAAIAEGVRDLEIDDAVYILEDLTEEDQEEVLARLPAGDRVALERSLDYPENSAGRLMQLAVIAVPPFWSVGQTIDFMRESEDLPERFYELFVTDPAHRVIGRVALDSVLRTKRPLSIQTIMEGAEHIVRVDDDQEDVARLFRTYNLVSIPVVDAADRLVGVLTFDDIVDVIEEEADADIRALGGVNPNEELSDNVLSITRSRFAWLIVNLLTAFLASLVLKGFESELEKMVALAVLAPIVASQGGNAATQTMTVAVRALATREISSANALRVIGRELAVGALNGVAFAAITGLIAGLWFDSQGIALVIGIAMIVNLFAAALAGILIPLALERLGFDPAVASSPFVTTVTDVVGFFAFLGTATLWFGLT